MSEVTSKALVWDEVGEHWYENGVDHCALYLMGDEGTYEKGVAWNGITKIGENPDGGDSTDLWADNIKYGSLRAAENFKGTIEAYTFPKEFHACDGYAELVEGITIGQQSRRGFGLAYRTNMGNDTPTDTDDNYKLHLVYGATVSPSDKDYETINDNPDAITFSWEFETIPVPVTGKKPTAHVVINAKVVGSTKMTKIESKLFGTTTTDPVLLMPDEIVALLSSST